MPWSGLLLEESNLLKFLHPAGVHDWRKGLLQKLDRRLSGH